MTGRCRFLPVRRHDQPHDPPAGARGPRGQTGLLRLNRVSVRGQTRGVHHYSAARGQRHCEREYRVYLRLPMPYLGADRQGAEGPDGLPQPAPYTTNRMEDGKLVHRLDADALRAKPKGLGRLVAEGHPIPVEGQPLAVDVEQVRAYPGTHQLSFASIEDAKASFHRDVYADSFPSSMSAIRSVGDTVVDVIFRYGNGSPVYDYAFSSTLDPGLPGQYKTANLQLDHYAGETRVFRARGLHDQPISISRSAWAAAVTFVKEGVRHIPEGWDHVLFVICLALGAAMQGSLLWRATGFTIGHSVTLIAGFLDPSRPARGLSRPWKWGSRFPSSMPRSSPSPSVAGPRARNSRCFSSPWLLIFSMGSAFPLSRTKFCAWTHPKSGKACWHSTSAWK